MTRYFRLERQLTAAAKAAPYLGRDEERDLAQRWTTRRDEKALHELARAHMRLVIAISVRFGHYGLPVNDLVQEGHVGLLQAASRFDPDRDLRFSTYAKWWIRAAIQDYVLRNWSIVRGGTSSSQKALFFNLRRLRARLAIGGAGSVEMFDQIASTLGVRRTDVELMAARLAGPDISLNAPISESDSTAAQPLDLLPDNGPLPDEIIEKSIDDSRRAIWLQDALKTLTAREQDILQQRWLSEKAATFESLGDRLGVSKERVRQIEISALAKLRRSLNEFHGPDCE